jgi:hypothetical protein
LCTLGNFWLSNYGLWLTRVTTYKQLFWGA